MIRSVLFLGILILLVVAVGADDEILQVEVDIFVPGDIVSIEMDNFVDLGNVTLGFDEVSERVRVNINNTGTVNVTVTPDLVDKSDAILQHLYFARRTTVPYSQIGLWDLDIERPNDFPGEEEEYFYMRLDLTEFTGDLENDLIDYSGDVMFVAVSDE
tara:strand:- start:950 stop:1423 length:474 start_codon:yes stop_codon:yes gene_type:complete